MPAAPPVPDRPSTGWDYPPALPVSHRREDILAALQQEAVIILCGATGSGKSTQIPKLCLEAGRGRQGLIAHTQPRRLAARALAERVAAEIGETAGQTIGWQVRFKSVVSAQTRVKFLTDGVLLNELRHDPRLERYDTIIIDEAHERSLNIDFLLGCLQRLRRQRPDLKLIITSATLDAEKFSRHFDGAPVIDVAGRSHPIELRYRPPPDERLPAAIAAAVDEIWRDAPGDILIFLPGEREIRETAQYLGRQPALKRQTGLRILPLFARLGSARQQAIFSPGGGPRLVLATNIAETSLTVPGIRHVIDTGVARLSRYNPRSQLQALNLEPISQASADQRRGRCGREAPGICLRLYAEEDFAARPAYTEPEIQRTNLAAVLLQMADLGLGAAEKFPFVDAPARRYLSDARRLLRQIGALDDTLNLTAIGRQLARLPVDPRLGRILLAGEAAGIGDATLILVAALSIQDPRIRHAEVREQADKALLALADERSDFLDLLALWEAVERQRKAPGSADFKRWCEATFLHRQRLQEWRDLVRQLRQSRRLKPQPGPVSAEALHRAVLSGLLDHIGSHEAEGEYLGSRGSRWRIHPESRLARRRPRWIVAAELLRTGRSYGRVIAPLRPAWIEAAAGDLLRRHVHDPVWDAPRGEVMAREQVSLFGLVLASHRRVPYAASHPAEARRIFIDQALVRGRWGKRQPPRFLRDYLAARRQLEAIEARARRRDLVRDDASLAEWFSQRLPERVLDRRGLLRWLKRRGPEALSVPAELLRVGAEDWQEQDYPAELVCGAQRYRLSYRFDPGSEDDGVSLRVPLAGLNALPAEPLDWLVPGFLASRIEALLRGLPKSTRRHFVPLNEAVPRVLAELDRRQPCFWSALDQALQRSHGQAPGAAALQAVPLPAPLCMRIEVLDENGRTIAAGRDLQALKARHGEAAGASFAALDAGPWQQRGWRRWEGPALPDQIRLGSGVQAFVHLRDEIDSVALDLADDPQLAARQHRAGQLRLLLLEQQRRLKDLLRNLPERDRLLLRLADLPSFPARDPLGEFRLPDLAWACAARAVLELQASEPLRDAQAFAAARDRGAAELGPRLRQHWQTLSEIAAAWRDWASLQTALATLPEASRDDLKTQLEALLPAGFLLVSPLLPELPRYLRGMVLRAQRALRDPAGDLARLQKIRPFQERWLRLATPDAPAAQSYRQLLEEFRISVFAQQLGTRGRVSPRRLDEAWRSLGEA